MFDKPTYFDGDNHVIKDLVVSSTYDYSGLFGYVGDFGESSTQTSISNLGVIGGNISGDTVMGGVAGFLGDGDVVDHCSFSGTVSGNDTTGGVVGLSYGGTVQNCYNNGAVTTSNGYSGGVVGNAVTGTVQNCYNTGHVVSGVGNRSSAGGIVGYISNHGVIQNCYNTGNVESGTGGFSAAGGIVGQGITSSTVQNCYSAGTVTGYAAGGISGGASNGDAITNCIALGSSVTAGASYIGRICGMSRSTMYSQNYAWAGMQVNGATVTSSDPTSINGADIGASALVSSGAWSGFTSVNGWTYSAGELPILANAGGTQDTTIPTAILPAGPRALDNPTGLSWVSDTTGFAQWDAVPNAGSYTAKLYKDSTSGTAIDTESGLTEPDFNFYEIMAAHGAGSYYFTVTAVPTDTAAYQDSDVATVADACDMIASNAPDATNITITNNPIGTRDDVKVSGLEEGDLVSVYSDSACTTLLDSASVPVSATSVDVFIRQLGTTAGTVYVTVTSYNKAESSATAKSYGAEPASEGGATAPAAPSNVHATAGDGQASVSFTAPSNNGGAAITGYTVTATPVGGGSAVTATGTASPIAVTGLHNGTAYTFTVKATNSAGTSSASAASASVTPAASGNPPSDSGVFTSQPQSQTVVGNQSITLRVTVADASSATFQWYKDGNALDGATSSSYTITGAKDSDAGSYTVKVTTPDGTFTSSAAIVKVDWGNPDNAPAKQITADTSDSSKAVVNPSDVQGIGSGNVGVTFGQVSLSVPASIVSGLTSDDLTSRLQFSQSASTGQTQNAIESITPADNAFVTSLDFSLTKIYSNGSTVAIHDLGGKIKVTIKLTDAQAAKITDPSTAKLYYYNSADNKLEPVEATFDLTNKTVTFETNHFSTYVIEQPAASIQTVSNPKTGDDSNNSIPYMLALSALGCIFILVVGKRAISRIKG